MRFLNPRILICHRTTQIFKRNLSLLEKSFTASTFCDVYIKVPFAVEVKPSDFAKDPECNKVFVKICANATCPVSSLPFINFLNEPNRVKIECDDTSVENDKLTCYVEAPIKACIEAQAKNSIIISNFHGEKLKANLEEGVIKIKKFTGEHLLTHVENGYIYLEGGIQAERIFAEVSEHGAIETDRLQGLITSLIVNNGSITVNSCYCDNSYIELNNGDLVLKNIHRDCTINVKEKGDLKLNGFDGKLSLVHRGEVADISISRIIENSKIRINGKGLLNLKLSPECQERTSVKIHSKDVSIDDNILMTNDNQTTTDSGYLILNGRSGSNTTLEIFCCDSQVRLGTSSWADDFLSKFK